MLRLHDLHDFPAVVIQCHNIPDADTIASAFALGRYFEQRGTPVRLVYGGPCAISKPNLARFVEALEIPLRYLRDPDSDHDDFFRSHPDRLLITVDCQHGAGNVQLIENDAVCVIDHHIKEKDLAQFELIEPYLGSCSTVIWRLLQQTDFDFSAHPDVATALYYGLYTDTNSFAELFHPMDRDLLDHLDFDFKLIRELKRCNLAREELTITGQALHSARFDDACKTALFEAPPCDPNILGFISDLAMQVKDADVIVGFTPVSGGIKLSLRSATSEVMANELAGFLTEGRGSGGGNKEKAGGFLRLPEADSNAADFLSERLLRYFDNYDTIVSGEYQPDTTQMLRYKKKPLQQGYVRLSDLYPEGTEVIVRTLEGDATFSVSAETYLMIGVQGEAYPIDRQKFERSYTPEPGTFSFLPAAMSEAFYAPTVKDRLRHELIELLPHAKPCRASGETFIYARPLERSTKVFTSWYADGYMHGKPGDYLAARSDNTSDLYIIAAPIFQLSYESLPDSGR